MGDFNFTLIISQYRWSRHSFIVKFEDNFLEKAKAFATELMTYKRGKNNNGWAKPPEENLGDLTYHKDDKIYPRYNVNDAGDIYFINTKYANYCKDVAFEYAETSRRETVGYKPKALIDDISTHHNYNKVKEILEKHFEIA
jgi:hypothetical protein